MEAIGKLYSLLLQRYLNALRTTMDIAGSRWAADGLRAVGGLHAAGGQLVVGGCSTHCGASCVEGLEGA